MIIMPHYATFTISIKFLIRPRLHNVIKKIELERKTLNEEQNSIISHKISEKTIINIVFYKKK